jgi:hypothetical protein
LREGTATSIIIPRSNSTESLPSYFSAVNNSRLSGPLNNTCKCKKSGQVVIYLKPMQHTTQPTNTPSHNHYLIYKSVHQPFTERPFSERPISKLPISKQPISKRPFTECDHSPNDQSPKAPISKLFF